MKKYFLPLFIIAFLTGCDPKKSENNQTKEDIPASFPYNMDEPTERFDLPAELKEISGLSYYKPNQLLCVQDEDAVVYVYDVKKKAIVDEFSFGGYGDFEGVEAVDGEIYVLQSNGDLFSFKPPSKDIKKSKTDLPGKNDVEGLGYNPRSKRLLLAVKESSKNGETEKDKIIYSFDLLNRAIWKELVIDGSGLNDFKPSGLAVDPLTGHYYLISSAGNALLVLDSKGKILDQKPLDKKLLRQPEGICFDPDGTMYISSEGKSGAGYILKYKPTGL